MPTCPLSHGQQGPSWSWPAVAVLLVWENDIVSEVRYPLTASPEGDRKEGKFILELCPVPDGLLWSGHPHDHLPQTAAGTGTRLRTLPGLGLLGPLYCVCPWYPEQCLAHSINHYRTNRCLGRSRPWSPATLGLLSRLRKFSPRLFPDLS